MRACRRLTWLSAAAFLAALPSTAAAFTLGDSVRLGLQGVYASPKWAPDGQGIALAGDKYGGLYIADVYGNLRQISDAPLAGWKFAWSPDGRNIAYRTRDEEGMGMRLNVAGRDGDSREITPTLNDLLPPTWDKDGITYRSGDELVTVDKDGKVLRSRSLSGGNGTLSKAAAVTGAMLMGRITGATFTALSLLVSQPRKSDAAFSTGSLYTDPDNLLWVVDENGNRRKLLDIEGEPGYFNPVGDGRGDYAVSGLSGNLYIASSDTTNVIELGNGSNPAWSPDGAYIVFERTTDDGHEITSSDLWIASADGTVVQRLTDTPEIEGQPSWSPDGKWIAYIVDGVVHLSPIGQ